MTTKLHIQSMRQQGLTLLEILIALLVLSIGMVGLGALLLTALSNVHSASQYSLASAIALDFEERVWHDISRISAEDPDDLDADGCLTDAQLATTATVLTAQWTAQGAGQDWNWTTADRFRAPDLNLVVGNTTVSTSTANDAISWQHIPLTIEWTEARFGLADDIEQYAVTVAVVCRPQFN